MITSMNGWSQVVTGVEFNCAAAMQDTHHIPHIIYQTLPPSKRRTSQPHGIWTWFLRSSSKCAIITQWIPPVHNSSQYQQFSDCRRYGARNNESRLIVLISICKKSRILLDWFQSLDWSAGCRCPLESTWRVHSTDWAFPSTTRAATP